MRKVLASVLMLVLLLPILAACGNEGTATDTTASTAPVASVAAASGVPTPAETEAPSESTAASAEASMVATEAATEATGTAAGGSCEARVGLVTDVGKVNDGTFNQFAYEGLQRAEQELGVEINFIETQQSTDYDKNLDQFANQGYELVIGVGFLMGDAISAAASRHPNTKFAIVDFAYETPPENVKGLVFAEDQAAYMVGTMAALLSQSGVIGVVGGVEIPPVQKYVQGYEAGAKAQNPDIQVRQVYIPSFTDPAQGAEAATSQIAEGADVIFGAGGQTGSGAIQAAAQNGAYVIGVDQDEYNTTFRGGSVAGSDRLVTSALKRVDNAVFSVIQDVCNDQFTNELYVGDAANGGVDYAEAHDASEVVTDEIRARVDEVKQGLADGSITTGVEIQ